MLKYARIRPAAAALLLPSWAAAHSFGTVYTLPIPFWIYAYGASAALIVSFALVGYFVNAGSAEKNFATRDIGGNRVVALLVSPGFIGALRLLSVAGLLLTIATGLFGARNSFTNFSMTFFWIAFALGFTYLTAVIGDLYALINPWAVLCDWCERIAAGTFRARLRYPHFLGYWPAFVLYFIYIWIELFGHSEPRSLGHILLAYSALNFAGAWLFGREIWFRYGELFAVFLRVIAMMAPFEYAESPAAGRPRFVLRQPFIGLLRRPAENMSLLVFVLFMLSSTAFDGAHDTLPWVNIFWKRLWPLIEGVVMRLSAHPYAASVEFFYAWQWGMLALSPFIYLGVYLFFIVLTKKVTRSDASVRELALRFAFMLVPIAFVYNITHYYTLLLTQGPSLAKLISDPFGRGWNLFGTRDLPVDGLIPSAGSVWHTQVWLILFGHIISVYVAHLEALRLFPTNRKAALSQIPILFLMVLFTTVGLWILSLPIATGQVIVPPPQ
jgi:hypothetical protein